MRFLSAALLVLALGGCSDPKHANGKARDTVTGTRAAVDSDRFPTPGLYDVVETDRATGKREEHQTRLDVSTQAEFLKQFSAGGGSNCRDVQESASGGSFSASAICDAPDGDIHNIGGEVHGQYSADSIDATSTMTLWGTPIVQDISYRLRK